VTGSPAFRSIRPKALTDQQVPADIVRVGPLCEQNLPFVLEPALPEVDLANWAKQNRDQVDGLLAEHSALLFRGFEIKPGSGFRRFAEVISTAPLEYTQRSTRRTREAPGVYTSTEYPAPLSIELHSENSFQRSWPQRIMFHSVVVAESGGATPIAANAAVYDAISPRVRGEFAARGVRYVRNFGGGVELSWQEAFQISSRAEVEQYFLDNSMTWQWKDGDRLRTDQVLPAIIQPPGINRPVWFNQAHLFHITNLAPDIRAAMLEAMPEADLPRHAYFGDGGVIPDEYMAEVRAAYERCKVRFAWRRNDVMLLDNLRICHGRDPFIGARKVLVSMSDPSDFSMFSVPADG
jgi:alpha-ketoglutarate-dependent taurine dioxygenase